MVLQAPKFEFVSNAKPSLFAYPAPTQVAKKETITKVTTAVLSTTAKAKAREKKKAAAEGDVMDTVCACYMSYSSILTRACIG
jgi:26S proteasome regulatory subunit N2